MKNESIYLVLIGVVIGLMISMILIFLNKDKNPNEKVEDDFLFILGKDIYLLQDKIRQFEERQLDSSLMRNHLDALRGVYQLFLSCKSSK